MIHQVQTQLAALANPQDAIFLQKYFKAGPGEYGAGDLFRGIRVPALRRLAREHRELPVPGVLQLLRSVYHDERLLALLILVQQYTRADLQKRGELYRLYLEHTRFINNWDLVDSSAGQIVGAHVLSHGNHEPLLRLAGSENLWERRIAIIATSHDIKRGSFAATLAIAERLLSDREDLIHKAVGWMLREVGKRDLASEEAFLLAHYPRMPRTMLRYAIERFPAERRLGYLKGTIPPAAPPR